MKKVATVGAMLAPLASFAADADYSTIVSAGSWTTVIAGIIAIGVATGGVVVAKKGVRFLISSLGGKG